MVLSSDESKLVVDPKANSEAGTYTVKCKIIDNDSVESGAMLSVTQKFTIQVFEVVEVEEEVDLVEC